MNNAIVTRLAAIYTLYDGLEILPYSLRSVIDHVDQVIFVYQNVSNFGEEKDTRGELAKVWDSLPVHQGAKITSELYTPIEFTGAKNETIKRNRGLTIARNLGCTHFAFIDTDEVWHNFHAAKQQYFASGAEGSVAEMYTYFRRPTLRLENVDNYYVPFIHALRADTVAGLRPYPFYVDPTRRVNCTDVSLIQERMHHFSWVRKDIEMKVRNSSAKENIRKSRLMLDYTHAAPGMYLTDYAQRLIEVENEFKIEI